MSIDDVIPGEARFRDLDPRVRRLFVGFAFSALGSGLTMPFLYVYLAEVRGFSTASVGLVFAWLGLLGFLAAPLGGTLIDTFGPKPVMVSGLLVESLATMSIGRIETVAHAYVVASVMVLGTVGLYPAATAMLTRLVPVSSREKVYGFNFMLLNAGLGVGGLVSALIIDVDSVASFQRLYLIDGATYLIHLAAVLSLPRGTGSAPARDAGEDTESIVQVGWSVVLRDRTLLRVIGFSVIAVTFGYAQMEAGLAAYAVEVADVPAKALGLAYAANTGAIVFGQLVTLRLIKGRRRSAMLALCAATWSVSWAIIAYSDRVDGWFAIGAIVVGLGLFGLGETIWAPVGPALVNDLAPEEMRGRYNALQSMTFTIGTIVGPATAGMLIGNDLPHVWVGCVVGGTALAAVAFLSLRRQLTDAQDGLSARGDRAAVHS
ncbi:MAG: MFS transporter [Nocardioides sp.]